MPLTYTVSDATAGSTIVAADLNSRFDDVKSKFAAGIVNGDIATTAAISVDKLDANYEHMDITLRTTGANGTWPATTYLDAWYVPDDGKGNWVVSTCGWASNDVGLGTTASFQIKWGAYDASGTFVNTTTVVSTTILTYGTANVGGQAAVAVASTTLTAGTGRGLYLYAVAADATCISAASGWVTVSLHLYRKIANG